MTTFRKYLKETAWAVAAKGAAFVFYYAVVYYLTRRMAVERWGEWSGFLAILNVTMLISDQGINIATKRFVAAARDTPDLAGVIRGTFLLRIVASLLYVGLVALLAMPVLRGLDQPQFLPLLQCALLLVGLYGIVEYFKSLFEALHRLRFTFVVTAIEHGLKFLFVVALFGRTQQFSSIVTALTLGVGIASLAGAAQTMRAVPGILRASVPKGLWQQVYLYSLPVLLTSIGGFISLEIDVIMLKSLRSNFDTGIYSAAKQIVIFLPHIALTLSMSTIPGMAAFDSTTAVAQRIVFYRIFAMLAGIYFIVCAGLVLFAFWGVKIFFPPEYAGTSIPLLMLIPFVLFNAITIYTGNLMIYRGLAWQRSLNAALTIVANILLNWWLIPLWGPLGAAAASSIAYLPYAVLNLRAADNAFLTVQETGT